MNTIALESHRTEFDSFNGIKVFRVKSGKFKTNSINVFFHDKLCRENAAKNALLPAVLRRGCESFPAIMDISLYLEDLYGASFDCGVTKKGENQIVQFYLEYVSDKYTKSNDNLTEKAFDLLYDIIIKPVTEDGGFKKEYVEQEKKNLKELIESRVNDKMHYAVEKCLEEMCKDEPFSIYAYGDVEDYDEINEKNLYEHYKYFTQELPIYVFISGDLEDDKVRYITERLKKIQRGTTKPIENSHAVKNVDEVKNITEQMNINQGKLSIGFRANIDPNSDEYYSLLVYNSILGGGLHSKLFQNVREKAGLAYYVFSRLEKFKGLMVISSGIETGNKQKAIDIINKQIEDIKEGSISDYEYQSAIKSIETGIESLKDSQLQVVDFYLSQYIVGTNDTPDGLIEKVKKVTVDDVISVSNKIKMDTVYFLTCKD